MPISVLPPSIERGSVTLFSASVVLIFLRFQGTQNLGLYTRIPEAVHTPGTCTPSQFYILATPPSLINRNFANSRAFDINQVVGFVYKY